MPSELTLIFNDENGQEQRVIVNANPFTMGRQEGNELVIRDSSLSRRHALITSFNGVAQISDCGSQNGTFLNGKRLSSAAILKHGDLITIGQDCNLRVQIVDQAATPPQASTHSVASPTPTPTSHPVSPVGSSASASTSFAFPTLSPALLATVAMIGILVIAGLMIGLLIWKKAPPPNDETQVVVVDSTPAPATSETASAIVKPVTEPSAVPATNDQLEKSLVQVIRYISNDSDYPFPPAIVAEIKRRADQFASPTLATTLRTMAARSDDTINQIKAQGLKKPALPIYMALAETNGGQGGDPMNVARQMVSEVQFLRAHFGSEFADPTLMLVAAHKIPGGSKKSHPLLQPLRQLVKNPQTDRNVWFLREKGALSDAAYEFVLRFLAYGAIAQNPRQFGLDAPALVF